MSSRRFSSQSVRDSRSCPRRVLPAWKCGTLVDRSFAASWPPGVADGGKCGCVPRLGRGRGADLGVDGLLEAGRRLDDLRVVERQDLCEERPGDAGRTIDPEVARPRPILRAPRTPPRCSRASRTSPTPCTTPPPSSSARCSTPSASRSPTTSPAGGSRSPPPSARPSRKPSRTRKTSRRRSQASLKGT